MGGASPVQVGLGCRRKQSEQAVENKPGRSFLTASTSVPASMFLPLPPSVMGCGHHAEAIVFSQSWFALVFLITVLKSELRDFIMIS